MKRWVRVFVVMPADQLEEASKFAKKLDRDTKGEDTFSARLSSDGLEPPDAYGASTLIRENTLEQLTRKLPEFSGAKIYLASEGWTWRKALQDAGLRPINSLEQA